MSLMINRYHDYHHYNDDDYDDDNKHDCSSYYDEASINVQAKNGITH
jgi:hypothetical protein